MTQIGRPQANIKNIKFIKEIDISISHIKGLAIASAIVEIY